MTSTITPGRGNSGVWELVNVQELGSSAILDIGSIDPSYRALHIIVIALCDIGTANKVLAIRFNADATAAHYDSYVGGVSTGQGSIEINHALRDTGSVKIGFSEVYVMNNATTQKIVVGMGVNDNFQTIGGAAGLGGFAGGKWLVTDAITRVQVGVDWDLSGTLAAGSRMMILGLRSST